jgi:hypothetical protein
MSMDKNQNEEIARVAYTLYEKRGYSNGKDFADWIEAEKIVSKKYGKASGGNGKSHTTTQQSKTAKK